MKEQSSRRGGNGFSYVGRTLWEEAKASVTFRVTSLLVVQQCWASLQRAPVAGDPYLLALSKSSLNGVLGGKAILGACSPAL